VKITSKRQGQALGLELERLRDIGGEAEWTCEKARKELEESPNRLEKGRPAQRLKGSDVFSLIRKQSGWNRKLLPLEDAFFAVHALRRLNSLADKTLAERGFWATKVKESDFSGTLKADFALAFQPLEENERIESLTAIVTRIAKLHAAGEVVLSAAQMFQFQTALFAAASVAAGADAECKVMFQQFAEIGELTQTASWVPSEKWREINADETAAQYFERMIAPLPFEVRPSTTQLSDMQPDLYRSLRNLCADQKRFNRTGVGEIGKARALSEVLPIGPPKPPRRGAKREDDIK